VLQNLPIFWTPTKLTVCIANKVDDSLPFLRTLQPALEAYFLALKVKKEFVTKFSDHRLVPPLPSVILHRLKFSKKGQYGIDCYLLLLARILCLEKSLVLRRRREFSRFTADGWRVAIEQHVVCSVKNGSVGNSRLINRLATNLLSSICCPPLQRMPVLVDIAGWGLWRRRRFSTAPELMEWVGLVDSSLKGGSDGGTHTARVLGYIRWVLLNYPSNY